MNVGSVRKLLHLNLPQELSKDLEILGLQYKGAPETSKGLVILQIYLEFIVWFGKHTPAPTRVPLVLCSDRVYFIQSSRNYSRPGLFGAIGGGADELRETQWGPFHTRAPNRL
jgi:hypothetical protein